MYTKQKPQNFQGSAEQLISGSNAPFPILFSQRQNALQAVLSIDWLDSGM